MTKRLAVLVLMLVAALSLVAPALAQEYPSGTITVTGVVDVIDTDPDGNPAYGITDEATGEGYILGLGSGPGSPISGYEGERVTIDGVPRSAPGGTVLDIVAFAPVRGEGPSTGPAPDRFATLSFELTVEGEPPEDAFFLGLVPAEGGIRAPLADPDGDGVYTGNVAVDMFPPGPVSPDSEPVSLPVQIVQGATGLGPQLRMIENFGTVLIDGDKTFESSVSFEGDGGPGNGPGDGSVGEDVTATFELDVRGEVPARTGFSGEIGSAPTAAGALLDQDGDGVYTLSLPVERDSEQEVRIERLDPINDDPEAPVVATTLKDFGTVEFDEDKTFRARINFNKDGGDTTTPDTTTPGPGNGSDNSDGSSGDSGNNTGSSGSGSGGSGSGNSSGGSGNGKDSGSGGSGSVSGGSGGGSETGSESSGGAGRITGLLPSTGGGVALTVLIAGVLLVAGGLLVRRLSR